MRRLVTLVMVGLLGCSPATTTKAPTPVAAPAAPAAPVVPPAPAPTEIYVRELFIGSPIFFADETRPLRQALGERLARAGYSVVSLEGLDGVLARAEARKCAAPGSRYGAWRVSYPGASFADGGVSCSGTPKSCRLWVTVGSEGGGAPTEWHTAVPEDATVEQLVAAAAQLEPEPPKRDERGVFGIVRRPRLVEGVKVRELSSGGAGVLAAHQAALDACLDDVTADERMDLLRAEVDAAGHARRCEVAPSGAPPSAAAACLCDVVKKTDLGQGPAGRRFLWMVEQHAPLAHAADGRAVGLQLQVAEESDASLRWQAPRFSRRALAACWDGAKLDADAHVSVVLTVGATGAVTYVALGWPPGLDPAPRACVSKLLTTATFTCPSAADAKIYADLQLTPAPK